MGSPHLIPAPITGEHDEPFVSLSACGFLSKMKQEVDGSTGFTWLASHQLYLLSVPATSDKHVCPCKHRLGCTGPR